MNYKKLSNEITAGIAVQLYSQDLHEDSKWSYAEVKDIERLASEKYRNDFRFHTRVVSLVAVSMSAIQKYEAEDEHHDK